MILKITQWQYPYRVMQRLYRLLVISARTYKTENKPIRDNAQISAGPDANTAVRNDFAPKGGKRALNVRKGTLMVKFFYQKYIQSKIRIS